MTATILNFPDGLTDAQRKLLLEGPYANHMGMGSMEVLREYVASLPQARRIMQNHIQLHKSSVTHKVKRTQYWVAHRHQATPFNGQPAFSFRIGIHRRQLAAPHIESCLSYVYRIETGFELVFESLQVHNACGIVIA